MNINEIIALANEYEGLAKNAEYTQHFLTQVEKSRTGLSLVSGGAEMDIHHDHREEFLATIHTYLASLHTRMDDIQVLLEGNYAEG